MRRRRTAPSQGRLASARSAWRWSSPCWRMSGKPAVPQHHVATRALFRRLRRRNRSSSTSLRPLVAQQVTALSNQEAAVTRTMLRPTVGSVLGVRAPEAVSSTGLSQGTARPCCRRRCESSRHRPIRSAVGGAQSDPKPAHAPNHERRRLPPPRRPGRSSSDPLAHAPSRTPPSPVRSPLIGNKPWRRPGPSDQGRCTAFGRNGPPQRRLLRMPSHTERRRQSCTSE